MHNHVILCGYGRIGHEIAQQLAIERIPLLVVEMDHERKTAAEQQGLPVLMADATLDETLVEAGIHRCRSLVAALPNNAANLYVVLSARGIAPHCRLVARSDGDEAERKLKLAGATQVVSPYVAGGRTMAATALRPLAVDFMELLAGSECEVEEFLISTDADQLGDFNGRTLAELDLKARTGALVLALRTPSMERNHPYHHRSITARSTETTLVANPSGNEQLAPGQLMVVMGSKEQLSRFAKLLGPALVNVNAMLG